MENQTQQKNWVWLWWAIGIIGGVGFITGLIFIMVNQEPPPDGPAVCSSFVYSDWSGCSTGIRSRRIDRSLPDGCSGGNPITVQNCDDIKDLPISSPTAQKRCLHTSEVQFSTIEESRMKEIIMSVMQGGINVPTPAIYNEFWSILDRYGRLCEEDIVLTRNGLVAAAECSKLFYQDALYSVRAGQVYKSPQRLDCENKTISALLSADKASARIKANDDLMYKIATGQPIATAAGGVILTEEKIQTTLDDISSKLERVNQLFSTTLSNI